jgi:putative ABC transport system permease protein
MSLKDVFFGPFHAMRTKLLCSIITVLGIVVGVALVIVLSGFSSRLDGSYPTEFDSLARAVTIYTSAPSGTQATGIQSLSDGDVKALTQGLNPAWVQNVIPIAKGSALVRNQGVGYRAGITGSTPDYLTYKNTPLIAGTMFTQQQYQGAARVALIGPSVVKYVYGGDNSAALGSTLFIGRLPFKVIGLMDKNATGNGGSSVVAPMTTVRNDLLGGVRTVGEIGLVATSVDAVSPAVDQVSTILERTHTQTNGLQEDFSADTFQSGKSAVGSQLANVLFWFASAVAAISLLIGLISLSIIMSTAVAERSSEIGVRRAFGARRAIIRRQFLRESFTIAGVLGLVGVGVGVVLVLVGQSVLPDLAPQYGVPHLSVVGVLLGFALSLLIGLLAGLYPATRASRLVLPEALRYWRHGHGHA